VAAFQQNSPSLYPGYNYKSQTSRTFLISARLQKDIDTKSYDTVEEEFWRKPQTELAKGI